MTANPNPIDLPALFGGSPAARLAGSAALDAHDFSD
jgi:hypothetical protein